MSEKQLQNQTTEKIFAAKTTDEIIAVMREEDEAAERENILKKMTPAFREKLNYFEDWLRKEVDHTLRSRYELGLMAKELYEDEKNNGGKLYGRNAMGRICKILCWDDGLIRLALRFVQAYSPADLERLCGIVLPSGEPLTWSHVRALVALPSAAQRKELLEKTIVEGWTCNELALEIKHLPDRPGKDGRGRPPRMPKDFDVAVAQQQQSADKWDRHYTRVWGATNHSLETEAAKLPPEEVTEKRLRQAQELAYQLRRVADQAQKQAEKAEEVVHEFERILDERRRADVDATTATTARRKTA
jgi:hypothetical protein